MNLGDFALRKLMPTYQTSVSKLHNLRYLFLELTQRCNLECLHCGSDCTRNVSVPDLPQETILKVLREVKEKYDSHKIMIALSGGEPLCYPNLFALGAEIHRLEFPWGMVTNGYNWTEKTITEAQAAGMSSITVSLDGLEDEHNWLRGRPDSFARAVNTIKLLVANPFYQVMDVITCINKRTLPLFEDIYKLIRDIGITRWRLFTISPIGRAKDNAELILNGEEFHQLFTKIEDIRSRHEISVSYSESGYLGPHHETKVRGHRFFCQAGISVAGIMVNGDILACPNIDRRFRQGNIAEGSFVDIWENRYEPFRNRSWMRTDKCIDCSEWSLCRGNSFHLWDLDHDCTRLCYHNLMNHPSQD